MSLGELIADIIFRLASRPCLYILKRLRRKPDLASEKPDLVSELLIGRLEGILHGYQFSRKLFVTLMLTSGKIGLAGMCRYYCNHKGVIYEGCDDYEGEVSSVQLKDHPQFRNILADISACEYRILKFSRSRHEIQSRGTSEKNNQEIGGRKSRGNAPRVASADEKHVVRALYYYFFYVSSQYANNTINLIAASEDGKSQFRGHLSKI